MDPNIRIQIDRWAERGDVNLKLWIHNPNQRSAITLPPTVRHLSCTNVTLRAPLPPLRSLFLSGTNELPVLPDTLEELALWDIPISALPPLPPNLKKLTLVRTGTLEWPTLPPTVAYLQIEGTLTLPAALPPALEALNCENIPVTRLPPLPPHLDRLYCLKCPLEELPTLPPSLKSLTCVGVDLPLLPQSLSWLISSEYNSWSRISPNQNQQAALKNFIRDHNIRLIGKSMLRRSMPYLLGRAVDRPVQKDCMMVDIVHEGVVAFL